jgi:DNA modification methylase
MAPGKTTQIYRCGAEDLPWDSIKNVDCAFTSPPYFSTERYNEGGEFEEDQSWSKFNEYDKWRDEFYLPVALNSFNSLSENGFLMTNIMDPKIKGSRYRSCDELVDSLQPHFLGQIGMRIMQRPQGKNKFKTKEELIEFMNKLYIENVWCFGKNKVFDLFRHKRRATLESLFQ